MPTASSFPQQLLAERERWERKAQRGRQMCCHLCGPRFKFGVPRKARRRLVKWQRVVARCYRHLDRLNHLMLSHLRYPSYGEEPTGPMEIGPYFEIGSSFFIPTGIYTITAVIPAGIYTLTAEAPDLPPSERPPKLS